VATTVATALGVTNAHSPALVADILCLVHKTKVLG